MQPETLTLDRLGTPLGTVLVVTDIEGAVCAFDFADYEEANIDRLVRDYPEHEDMIRDIMRHQPSPGS